MIVIAGMKIEAYSFFFYVAVFHSVNARHVVCEYSDVRVFQLLRN